MVKMEEKDLYRILGVNKDADTKEIKTAYKNLARENHPDKGGDPEKFKIIQSAYEVLGDEEKRKMYDLTGNTQEGGGMGGFPFGGMGGMGGMGGFPFGVDMSDLFGGMFGMPRGRGGSPVRHVRRPKGPNKIHELPLSVADFYNGKKIRMDLARQSFCKDCNGEGCSNWKTCMECRGTGVKEMMIQLGPGMSALNRGPCNACRSEGRLKGLECSGCNGKGLLASQKTLDIEIKPGAGVGDILTFEEACSDHQEFEKPGDVQIRLVEASEIIDIERDGNHFRFRTEISLKESLLGCKRTIQNHPGYTNGCEVEIPSGSQNGDCICVKGLGMVGKGDLFLHIRINVKEEERKILESSRAILQSLFN